MAIGKICGLVVLLVGCMGGLLGAIEHRICTLGNNMIVRRYGHVAAYRASLATGIAVEMIGLWLYFFAS